MTLAIAGSQTLRELVPSLAEVTDVREPRSMTFMLAQDWEDGFLFRDRELRYLVYTSESSALAALEAIGYEFSQGDLDRIRASYPDFGGGDCRSS